MTQFDLFGAPIESDEGPPVSAGRRLTQRLHALAEAGLNPLVGTRGPEGQTCGECEHRRVWRYHNRSFPKCDLGPDSHGPKTDVRKTWPACHRFEPKAE